ncbi:MAG: hypothetical protein WC824_10810, partial [Bacteroidota bacterium]
IFDLLMDFQEEEITSLLVPFRSCRYISGRCKQFYRALHYKVEDGVPVLDHLSTVYRGGKTLRRVGTGSIKGDVIRHIKGAWGLGKDYDVYIDNLGVRVNP